MPIKTLLLTIFVCLATCTQPRKFSDYHHMVTAMPIPQNIELLTATYTQDSVLKKEKFQFQFLIKETNEYAFPTIWLKDKSYAPKIIGISNTKVPTKCNKKDELNMTIILQEDQETQTHQDRPKAYQNTQTQALLQVETPDTTQYYPIYRMN